MSFNINPLGDDEPFHCMSCGSTNTIKVFDPRYNGYRGHCLDCGGNWPES